MEESVEAADGEEFTNKFLTLECKSADPSDVLDSRGLKRFREPESKEFQQRRKVSSIMWAKVLSSMRANAGQGTFD